jgi:hypothetical protein
MKAGALISRNRNTLATKIRFEPLSAFLSCVRARWIAVIFRVAIFFRFFKTCYSRLLLSTRAPRSIEACPKIMDALQNEKCTAWGAILRE